MAKKSILIIEDEEEVAELVANRLNGNGYNSICAHNGLEGLEKLRKIKPDLIILDLNMPKMGGIEFYQHICDTNSILKYPVLVLTARANMEQLFRGFNVNGFLHKPFKGEQLLDEVRAILREEDRKRIFRTPREIIIVDNNVDELSKISSLFTSHNYKVVTVGNGTTAIEKISKDLPDLALIQLGLNDIAGDLVILRLQQITKTKHIPCILYLNGNVEHHKAVLKRFGDKSGVRVIKEYHNPEDLMMAVDEVFLEIEQKELEYRGLV
jgi:DNA-binding response OmpR family regulator